MNGPAKTPLSLRGWGRGRLFRSSRPRAGEGLGERAMRPAHFFLKNTNNPDFITGGISQLISSINANTARLLKKYDGSAS